ncbi:hypothetical protein [Lysinibacillus sp. 54212]|uniref:hypothetical protein n=1 Tax=Lysinibacillus sp. 54212 TaxID=3119829 RepID=UPI002FCA1F6B
MRDKAIYFESQHYNSMMEMHQNNLDEKEIVLEVKIESLKILYELYNRLNYDPSKRVVLDDFKACENEIIELKLEIDNAKGNLKTFEEIVEKLKEIKE